MGEGLQSPSPHTSLRYLTQSFSRPVSPQQRIRCATPISSAERLSLPPRNLAQTSPRLKSPLDDKSVASHAEELPRWMRRHNWHRAHGGLDYQTPISCLGLNGNNLLRLHN